MKKSRNKMKKQQLGDVMKKRWRVQVGDIVRHKEFGTVFIVTNTDLYISILGTTGYVASESVELFNLYFEKIGESSELGKLMSELRKAESDNVKRGKVKA